MRTHTVIDSPIGALTLVATDGALNAVYMVDHKRLPELATFGERVETGFEEATAQFGEYFAGRRREFSLRTDPFGTDFQQRVWKALTTIPYGETWSYAELADAVGDRKVIRAVGAANGRNPLSIIVPCHRVIGSDGSLTGYAGGLDRKRFLLDLERAPDQRPDQLF